MQVTRKDFEKMVEKGIDAIPEKFIKKLDNVSIVVEDEPSLAQKRKLRLHNHDLLFGLYEGIPKTKRGWNYGGVLPDKITIFKNPMLAVAYNAKDIEEMIRDTVWHEVAHHFGFDEARVRTAEAKRKKANRIK